MRVAARESDAQHASPSEIKPTDVSQSADGQRQCVRRRDAATPADVEQCGLLEVDVLTCQHCGGRRKLLDATTEPGAIRRVLEHLGLPTDVPVVSAARAPPMQRLPFE